MQILQYFYNSIAIGGALDAFGGPCLPMYWFGAVYVLPLSSVYKDDILMISQGARKIR